MQQHSENYMRKDVSKSLASSKVYDKIRIWNKLLIIVKAEAQVIIFKRDLSPSDAMYHFHVLGIIFSNGKREEMNVTKTISQKNNRGYIIKPVLLLYMQLHAAVYRARQKPVFW